MLPPTTPKYSHGFNFEFANLPTPQRQTSFGGWEGYSTTQSQNMSPAQPSTSSACSQCHRELPAHIRDPDQLVELPGQEIPPELKEPVSVIRRDAQDDWLIKTSRKLTRRSIKAISAIKSYWELIKLIAKYRCHSEPELKWSTQEWINFILTRNKLYATSAVDYCQTVINLTTPAQPITNSPSALNNDVQPATIPPIDVPMPPLPGPQAAVHEDAPALGPEP